VESRNRSQSPFNNTFNSTGKKLHYTGMGYRSGLSQGSQEDSVTKPLESQLYSLSKQAEDALPQLEQDHKERLRAQQKAFEDRKRGGKASALASPSKKPAIPEYEAGQPFQERLQDFIKQVRGTAMHEFVPDTSSPPKPLGGKNDEVDSKLMNIEVATNPDDLSDNVSHVSVSELRNSNSQRSSLRKRVSKIKLDDFKTRVKTEDEIAQQRQKREKEYCEELDEVLDKLRYEHE
jgi:hypothetical protein